MPQVKASGQEIPKHMLQPVPLDLNFRIGLLPKPLYPDVELTPKELMGEPSQFLGLCLA